MLGIDIEGDSMRLVELRKISKGYCVENYAIGTIDDLAKIKARIKHAAIALPYSDVFSKVIQLDAGLDDDEIENYLLVNMEKYTGIAAQNIILTAHALGLGTCYVGFITGLNMIPKLKKKLGIKYPYRVYTSIALGYPKVQQDKAVPREVAPITWVEKGTL